MKRVKNNYRFQPVFFHTAFVFSAQILVHNVHNHACWGRSEYRMRDFTHSVIILTLSNAIKKGIPRFFMLNV